jgi:transcriptional regulator with XRE-family HTH domain
MIHKRPSLGEFRPYHFRDMAGRRPSREAPPFGKRLAELRKERGFTQTELAGRLEISSKMVDYYERRATNPSLEIITKAATLFGVTIADMLGEELGRPRARPGPPSRLEGQLERVRLLPRRQQEHIIKTLTALLKQAEEEQEAAE